MVLPAFHEGATLPLDLGIIGAPGCAILVDIVLAIPLAPMAGAVSFAVSLPASAIGLSFYEQGYVVDPAANALGLTVTNAGLARVGV